MPEAVWRATFEQALLVGCAAQGRLLGCALVACVEHAEAASQCPSPDRVWNGNDR